MPLHQKYGSYFRVYVSPVQGILTTGSTYNLASGQVGIFDGDTYQAVTAPSFFQNRSLIVAQGMNPMKAPLMLGVPNSYSEKSENIGGGFITGWRGYRGKPGQGEIVAVGYDGADITKTLQMRKNEKRTITVKLTGAPINKMYSTDGLLIHYSVDTTEYGECCGAECDDCGMIDCNIVADILVDKINKDEGIFRHHGLIRATKHSNCTPPPAAPTATWDSYSITVADDGSDAALGRVQSQYSGFKITRVSRNNVASTTVYQMLRIKTAGAPAGLNTAINTFIPECPTCPAGYTASTASELFLLVAPGSQTIDGTFVPGLSAGQVQKQSELGGSTVYVVGVGLFADQAAKDSFIATMEAKPNTQITYLRKSSVSCTLTTPAPVAWTDTGDGFTYSQKYRITLKDPKCGSNWEATLKTIYGTGAAIVAGTPTADCVHSYELTVQSQFMSSVACAANEAPEFIQPPGFMGVSWVPVPVVTAPADCTCGVWIESAYVNRITNACTYGTFDYNADGVHIQISNFNADYNAPPGQGDDWPIAHLQVFTLPMGFGAALKELEERSKEVFLRKWSWDVAVNDAYNFVLFTDPNTFYDQYALEFTQKFVAQSGFTDGSLNRHTLNVYFPAGQGKAYETAINSYVASNPGLGLRPVAL